jgi:predicted RNA-binding protein with PUA-like domain
MKTEPGTWSWQDQVIKKTTHWDGVRNYQASHYLKQMRVGDRAFFYHSGAERRIVGIVHISREYYPDFTDDSGRFGMVDVTYDKALPRPVTLAQIKAEPRLGDLPLLRQSRLSVMPIEPLAWKIICGMGGLDAYEEEEK